MISDQKFFDNIKKQKIESECRLSPLAKKSYDTRGRFFENIDSSDIRTPFMRDRDRIIHSASFRRMKDKAQVFLLSSNDMIRTRLSHTLEVSQVARTIANVLKLNEDLVEAIALGHDLGHTPFGHIGERAVNALVKDWFKKDGVEFQSVDFLSSGKDWLNKKFSSFRHNIQSLRIVDLLENKGNGLNLTFEVRDGILNHSKWGKSLLTSEIKFLPKTLEGQIVRLSDRVTYVNHDLQDSIRLGFLKEEDIPKDILKALGKTHAERINTGVIDIIKQSKGQQIISMTKEVAEAIDSLYDFLFHKVYKEPVLEKESQKAIYLIKELAEFYKVNPQIVLQLTNDINYPESVSIEQRIIDHIANMTDHYIVREFTSRLLPSSDSLWFS